MKRIFAFLLLFSVALPLLFLSGCSHPVSDDDVNEMSVKANRMILDLYGEYDSAKLKNYVVSVGRKVEAASDYSGEPIAYEILDTPEFNHFSIPPSRIFMTRGLLNRMNSEAELAFVVGHELAHLTGKHTMMRLSEKKGAGAAGNIGALFVAGLTGSSTLTFTTYYMVFDYGSVRELEADEIGLQYMAEANYSPEAAISLAKSLGMIEKEPDKYIISTFNSTHPYYVARVDAMEKFLKSEAAAKMLDKRLYFNRNAYVKALNGNIVGESLEAGIVVKGVYKNKIYRFSLKAPQGWKLVTGRRYLAGFTQKERDFQVSAAIPGAGQTLEEYAIEFTKYLTNDENYKGGFEKTEISGHSTLKAEPSSIFSDDKTKVRFFADKGIYYAFYLKHKDTMFDDWNKIFDSLIADNFSVLSANDVANITEEYMSIYEATSGSTFDGISTKYYGSAGYAASLKRYNDFWGKLSPGTLLKIPPKNYIKWM